MLKFKYFLKYSMASLLSKFRIDYSALKVISDISKPAQSYTATFFESLITDFLECNQLNTNENAENGKILKYNFE